MDAKELGTFIAELRKEKEITQAELAKRLYVTDKAVSRWERGLGFPDIHTLEPLADALGVSLSELMKCERQTGPADIEADQGILASIDIAQRQRKQIIRRVIVGAVCCVIGLLVVLYAIHLFMTGSFSFLSSDGPTAVFVAGRISRWIPTTILVAGVVLFLAGAWMLIHSANNDHIL